MTQGSCFQLLIVPHFQFLIVPHLVDLHKKALFSYCKNHLQQVQRLQYVHINHWNNKQLKMFSPLADIYAEDGGKELLRQLAH